MECSSAFDSLTELERHIDIGIHVPVAELSTMNKVKSEFIKRMKGSVMSHTPRQSDKCNISQLNMEEALKISPLIGFFSNEGWALPVRSTFRYTKAQKKILYDIFINGEKTNKKMSAEQAELVIRQQLKPDEYVTAKQIKSLFSRWSQQYKAGKLKDPQNQVEKQKTKEHGGNVEDDSDEEYESEEEYDGDEIALRVIDELHAEVAIITAQLEEYKEDQ